MLFLHKAIDALSGAPGSKYRLLVMKKAHYAIFPELVYKLKSAEKFEFLDIPFEFDPGSKFLRLPTISRDEKQFWTLGLIPLPASICWYEVMVHGTKCGLLIEEAGTGWKVMRFDIHGSDIAWAG